MKLSTRSSQWPLCQRGHSEEAATGTSEWRKQHVTSMWAATLGGVPGECALCCVYLENLAALCVGEHVPMVCVCKVVASLCVVHVRVLWCVCEVRGFGLLSW